MVAGIGESAGCEADRDASLAVVGLVAREAIARRKWALDRLEQQSGARATRTSPCLRDRAQRPTNTPVRLDDTGKSSGIKRSDNVFAEWRELMARSRRNWSTTRT